MPPDVVASTVNRHRRLLLAGALFVGVAGLNFLLFPAHSPLLSVLGLALFVGAVLFVALVALPPQGPRARVNPTLTGRFLRWLTHGGEMEWLFPLFGVAILGADLGYNLILSSSPAILTEDTVALLLAAVLLGYRFVPSRFAAQRDFVLMFFILLAAILVVPLVLARALTRNVDASVDLYSWIALAPEVGALLGILGVANVVQVVAGASAPGLSFTPLHMSTQVTVVITTACSGIYSFGIFAAAFGSFVLSEIGSASRRVWTLFLLGVAVSYLANILRMVVIILIGYYSDTAETDLQNMLLAHSYAGWLIFLGWIGAFWGVILKALPAHGSTSPGGVVTGKGNRAAGCRVCFEPLTPAVPAFRCECGSYLHRKCTPSDGRCPACGRATQDGMDSATGAM